MEKQSGNTKTRTSIIVQIYVMIMIGMAVIGVITYFSQSHLAEKSKKNEAARFATEVAEEAALSVKEYPAYSWLLKYWYEHHDEMDVEYDVSFTDSVTTKEKEKLLAEHQPDLQLRYATEEEIRALPEEDQKLYAEIAYSWLITRFDEIKQNYNVNYLYCAATDTDEGKDPYQEQTFLVSAADKGSIRGANYHEVYPLGHTVSVEEKPDLQEAMRDAVELSRLEVSGDYEAGNYDYSGDYADYYRMLYEFDGHAVLVGVSYKITSMNADIKDTARTGTAYAVFYQFILVQLIMGFLFFYGISPLEKILKNINLYTETKNSAEVNRNLNEILSGKGAAAVRQNEIGQLSEDFIKLTDEIDHYVDNIERITKENERISAELELASRIQTSMLPSIFPAFPDREEVDIYAVMDPAREVGGDFYDFFFIDPDHLGVVIADVSGKGIPGALFMMISKVILQNCAMIGGSPAEIMKRTNRLICANNKEEMFVTIWFGILEISSGLLKIVNSGHEYPAYRKNGGQFELLKGKHSIATGIMEDIQYSEIVIQMEPGDKIFVYTDGVPEATNKEQQLYGTDRMIDALNEKGDGTPHEILMEVHRSVNEFVNDAEQFDDLTMLCVEYRGPGKENRVTEG